MEVVPGILLVFGPLVILGVALVGEALVQRVVPLHRPKEGFR